jgi:hypothetical protein
MAHIEAMPQTSWNLLANDIFNFRNDRRKPMKTSYILSVVVIVVFCCTGMAFSGNKWKDEAGRGVQGKSDHHDRHQDKRQGKAEYNSRRQEGNQRSAHHGQQEKMRHHDKYAHHGDYHKYHGYREHPYQNNRRYAHYKHRGHQYAYQGHWNSWKQWDRYAKAHPKVYRHGTYYRENAHLMFRFRDPVSGGFFFFSIGR